MTLDPAGLSIAESALVVAFLGAVVYVVGGSRFGVLLGIRQDAPLLLNPRGARLQGLVLGYGALLVAAGALVYALVEPHAETAALPWTLSWSSAAVLAAGTMSRVGRHAVFLVGGRTAVHEAVSPRDVVPVDEVGDDLDLAAAIEAARLGEWRPAVALLAATADVDVRADRIRTLGARSVHDGQWVEEWFAATPHDPRATVVRAELAMQRAWAARGALTAEHTSDRQIDAFFTGLAQAERLAVRATELDPQDPMPWATLVEIARGQQVDAEEFERRVNELFDRAPSHVLGSHAALQTVCAKWLGDEHMMFDLARGLAAEAPDGSATCLLPVMAHVEHHLQLDSGRGGSTRAARHMGFPATRTELRVCVDRWLAGPDGGPRPGGRLFGHNLAAYAFWLAGDAEAARPHLSAVGRSVTEMPWYYSGEPGEVLGVARRWAGLPVVAPAGGDLDPVAPTTIHR